MQKQNLIFKHKQTKQTVSVVLEHGSLLVMKGATQSNWLHSLPKSKNITQPRINLTFRIILTVLVEVPCYHANLKFRNF